MGKKLYVGNLPFQISEGDLEAKFGEFGGVTSCKIITDRETGRSKGFGFVEMDSDDAAQSCIEGMDGQEFNGRNIRVNEAKERSDDRRGGGGGRGRW